MAIKRVLVEVRVPDSMDDTDIIELLLKQIEVKGFTLDQDYPPVPGAPPEDHLEEISLASEKVVTVRGMLDEEQEAVLEANDLVLKVWSDAPIAPFDGD